jgi:hypothetical protein
VFTPESISRDAASLWNEIPEPIQKDYTKEYFDRLVYNMVKYSTCGVSYTAEPLFYIHTFHIPNYFMYYLYGVGQMSVRRMFPQFYVIFWMVPKSQYECGLTTVTIWL